MSNGGDVVIVSKDGDPFGGQITIKAGDGFSADNAGGRVTIFPGHWSLSEWATIWEAVHRVEEEIREREAKRMRVRG